MNGVTTEQEEVVKVKLKQIFCRHKYWEMVVDTEQKIAKSGCYLKCMRCGKIFTLD